MRDQDASEARSSCEGIDSVPAPQQEMVSSGIGPTYVHTDTAEGGGERRAEEEEATGRLQVTGGEPQFCLPDPTLAQTVVLHIPRILSSISPLTSTVSQRTINPDQDRLFFVVVISLSGGMGCTYSRVEVDEVVWRCKERRRLMKQLLSCRAELAAAHMAYLKSLRNTGATLLQFTEVETMILGDASPLRLTLPPSPPPPPPLPPSPPLPPNFSPIATKEAMEEKVSVEDPNYMDDDGSCRTPRPPVPGSVWDLWDPFVPPASSSSSSPVPQREQGPVSQAAVDEEDWAETKSEFEEEEEEEEKVIQRKEDFAVTVDPAREKCPLKELADDNSSAVSWLTKDTDMGMVVWRSKKTLAGIIREVDDYFLKAAAGGKDVAVLLESNRSYLYPWDPEARK
ncbi:hypothetical protein GW17_00057212, partial [Ensete ventricosum]